MERGTKRNQPWVPKMTKDMIKSINLLIEKRSDANVSGKYLFARQATSLRTMRARDVLSEVSGKIGLTYGNLIPEVDFSEAIKKRPYQF